MRDDDAYALVLLAFWACWSLSYINARLKCIAASFERLVKLAERGRG